MKRNWLTKEWLVKEFSIIGTTIKKVASNAECDEKTIRRNLKKFSLLTRDISEGASYQQAINCQIALDTEEVIIGELLGDGNLCSRCKFSARYQHSTSKRQYLEWLIDEIGLQSNRITKSNINTYHFSTKTYSSLKELYDKWYIDGKKKIPNDLKITPRMALHWYLGDGGKHSRNIITIGTYCFHKKELEFTMNQLNRFNPRLYYQCKNMPEGYGYRLAMNSDFLDWIGNCPEGIKNIYGYKW